MRKLRLTIDGDETNKYVYWRSETTTSFQNKEISVVKNPWFKRYCISARIIPLRPETQVRYFLIQSVLTMYQYMLSIGTCFQQNCLQINITVRWYDDNRAQKKRITAAFIYVDKPNCVTAGKNFCITTVDEDGNPLWSEVTKMFYPPNRFLKIEFEAGKDSELAIDNLVLSDCSPDRSTLKQPGQSWNKVKLIF